MQDNTVAGLYLTEGAAGNTIGGFGSGNNIIKNSSQWNLYNDQSSGVDATYNWWGTNIESEIDASIFDYYDDSTKGIVDFTGYFGGPSPCAPIPELTTVALISIGLLMLVGCARRTRED